MEEIEIWKDIPDYEGYYQCSTLGYVKSLDRIITRVNGEKQPIKGRILKISIDRKWYSVVELSKNGCRKTFKIHQLVAITFLGHVLCGMKLIIDHRDGNKAKNWASNLQIVTNRQNSSTCFRKNEKLYSSKYVGVYWSKQFNKWHSRIRIGKKQKHIGYFHSEEEASESYQAALSKI